MIRIDDRSLRCAAIAPLVALLLAAAAGCTPDRAASIETADRILPESLADDDPALNALALEVYRSLDRSAAEEPLRRLLRHERASVRFTALLVKAEQARRSDLSFFEWAYRQDEDPSVRLAAVYGMARLGYHLRMTALSDGLADRRAVVRRNAATILGLLENRSAAPMLKQHLGDPDPVVRLNVAESLARLGDTSGLPLVRAMAADAESPLQVNAILVLGRVGTASRDVLRLRELEAAAGRSDSAVRLAAFCAGGRWGTAQMPALIEVATGKESRRRVAPGHRAFALQLLARVAYGPAWREVAGSLDDGHPYVRLSAAWAMLSFSSPRARRVLKAVTRPDSPQRLSERDILRPVVPQAEPEGPSEGPLDVRRRNRRNSPLRPNFP